MAEVWHIYHVKKCRYTTPPKGKFVAIVCSNPNPYGFIINSRICNYVANNPALNECQVLIAAEKYSFLEHDSYINCGVIRSFKKEELKPIQKIQNDTRKAIKDVVKDAVKIAPIFKDLICGENKDKPEQSI